MAQCPDLGDENAILALAFLDIDGVLNTERLRGRYGSDYLCTARVDRVNELCEKSGASIVLTTTWAEHGRYEQTVKALRAVGLTAHVEGVVDYQIKSDDDLSDRSTQILSYVKRRESNTLGKVNYVVLDDLRLQGVPLVHIDDQWGILETDIDRAVKVLTASNE